MLGAHLLLKGRFSRPELESPALRLKAPWWRGDKLRKTAAIAAVFFNCVVWLKALAEN